MGNRATVHRSKGLARGYATGKHAVGIDHRSGFKVFLKDLKYEPGTNYLVTERESDWDHNIVTDALNFPPQKRVERIALRWSFPDVPLSIGTVVSAEQLFLPSYASVSGQFIDYASIGASPAGLDFSNSVNSQYYIILFQGI